MNNCAETGLGPDCGCDRIGHTVRDLPKKKHVSTCVSPSPCSERIHGNGQSLNDCIRALAVWADGRFWRVALASQSENATLMLTRNFRVRTLFVKKQTERVSKSASPFR
jgi:hypothetical protein